MGGKGGIYGLWAMGSAALRLCGSRRLGALATRGRGVFVFWIVSLSGSRCGCHARCVCASTPEAYGPTKERERTHTHRTVELPFQAARAAFAAVSGLSESLST